MLVKISIPNLYMGREQSLYNGPPIHLLLLCYHKCSNYSITEYWRCSTLKNTFNSRCCRSLFSCNRTIRYNFVCSRANACRFTQPRSCAACCRRCPWSNLNPWIATLFVQYNSQLRVYGLLWRDATATVSSTPRYSKVGRNSRCMLVT